VRPGRSGGSEGGALDLTLEQVQEAFYAELLSVPFHEHLGVALDRGVAPGEPRVTIPPKPEIVTADGQHSVAAVYTLGEAASAIEMCDEVAPRALELGMGAIFFTVSARFVRRGPAAGTIGAVTRLVSGLDEKAGEGKAARKATVEVAAKVVGEGGKMVGEQRFGFYVRFMELSRMRGMVRPASEVGRLVGP
jgi:hypothetical protein